MPPRSTVPPLVACWLFKTTGNHFLIASEPNHAASLRVKEEMPNWHLSQQMTVAVTRNHWLANYRVLSMGSVILHRPFGDGWKEKLLVRWIEERWDRWSFFGASFLSSLNRRWAGKEGDRLQVWGVDEGKTKEERQGEIFFKKNPTSIDPSLSPPTSRLARTFDMPPLPAAIPCSHLFLCDMISQKRDGESALLLTRSPPRLQNGCQAGRFRRWMEGWEDMVIDHPEGWPSEIEILSHKIN